MPKIAAIVQTAEILAERIGFRGLLSVTEKLSPGFGRADLRGRLADCAGAEGVALVGHEPDLGDLVASLLSLREPYRLKKGSVVALRLPRGGALSPAAFLWSAAGKEVVEEEEASGERSPPGEGVPARPGGPERTGAARKPPPRRGQRPRK